MGQSTDETLVDTTQNSSFIFIQLDNYICLHFKQQTGTSQQQDKQTRITKVCQRQKPSQIMCHNSKPFLVIKGLT